MRFGRQIHIEALQLDDGDVKRLARFVNQRRMKAKLFQLDERLGIRDFSLRRSRNRDSSNIDWRPNAQASALGPHPPMTFQAVAHRQTEAVQFHTRMKSLLQPLHNACAHIWLSPVHQHSHNDGQGS